MLFDIVLDLRSGIGALLACFLVAPAWAQSVSISDAWVRGTVAGQTATGAFMELKASENAALLGVSSPIAGTVEVHEMSMDKGVMKMRATPKLDLPAGKVVALKPGSYHIMLMDLKQPLKKGDSVPLTLKVEGKDKRLSTLEVRAEVRELTAPPAMEHKH
ncbi:MAG: copper chaperone PCu(A)C [Rhodocyclaceae bacterium]|nr:MAG: copper chaperone PCu(A)C [Rhodocyclaceae bacterium]